MDASEPSKKGSVANVRCSDDCVVRVAARGRPSLLIELSGLWAEVVTERKCNSG